MVVVVLRFSRPDRRKPVPPKAAHRLHALRSARALLLGVLVSALPTVIAAPPVLAQINNWGGDVLVSDSAISVAPGESVTYSVKLNRKPTETDGTALDDETVEWFVMVHINGVRYQDGEYKDLTLIPSFYHTFTGKHNPIDTKDVGDWDMWKNFRIYRASNDDWEGKGKLTSERATSVTLTHEVWDHNVNCPVHRRSPVTVGNAGNGTDGNGNGGNGNGGNGNGGNGNGGNGNGGNGNGGGGPIDTGNNAPVFSASSATRSFQENEGDATVTTAANLGAAIRADDSDDDPLTYTLEGSDSASFTIVEQTGQLRTKAGVNYNHEAKSSYRFTIRASDGTASDTIAVTVNVTDVDEPPLTPPPPVVSSVANSTTSLSVSWTPPPNAGRPPITSYDLQYREGTSGPWTDGLQNVTGTNTTISGRNADTLYQVHIRATNAEGDSDWSGPGSGRTTAPANNAPVFSASSAIRSFQENEGDATVTTAANLGAAIRADDSDDDPLTYTLEGSDSASFTIVEQTGQLRTKAGVNYNHEAKSSYRFTIRASDGTASDTIAVTVNVTDVDEPPLTPPPPVVSSVANSTTSLSVSWTPPPNAGRPPITSYDLQYREGTSGPWTDGLQNVTGTNTTISGRNADTLYQVHIRATNAEGDSDWSGPGSGRTTAPANNAPVFSASSATRSFQENEGDATVTTAANLGAAIRADDSDDDPLTYTLEGSDSASFTIVEQTGQLRTKAGVNYNHEAKSSYRFTIRASDGTASDTIAVTVNVTDVDEPPLTPPPPVVSSVANSTTSLSVSWTPPPNAGRPPITSYDLQYREGTSGPWTDGLQNVTGTNTTISGRNADTLYQVHIRATNAEGDSDWSGPGSGRTTAPANNAPVFSASSATRSFQENEGDATTTSAMDLGAAFTATDLDNGDSLNYTLEGPDVAFFTVDPQTGQLRTNANTNYDHEAKARYSVTVKVSDGTASDTIVVTINVTDLRERPLQPRPPAVSPVAGSATSLSVSWTAPSNAGRPRITSYDLQYREGTTGTWQNGSQNVTGTSTTISGLNADTLYQVQVLATNGDGDGDWSDPGSGRTNSQGNKNSENNAPKFSADTATRSLPETVGDVAPRSAINIGKPIAATDDDIDPLTYSLEGPDARYFTIDRNSGQLGTRPGVIYDHETRPAYTVTVKVSDGRANATIEVTINVEDLPEVPRAPAAPNVRLAPDGETGLSVSWKAPPNRGRPPITGYDLQYRTGPDAAWLDGPQDVAGTSTTITTIEDFDEELPYEVQVRAQNDEGDGPWSPPGRLSTGIEGDAVQTSWIVRFARTVGSQVLDAVTGRLNGGSGTYVSLGGVRTDRAALADAPGFGARPGREPAGWRETMRATNRRDRLLGSSFQLSAGGEQGDPTWNVWGRIGTARFDAKKNPVALFGDVVTAVVGADIERDRWLGGIAVSVSDGAGVFELAGDDVAGKASGRLTNVYGYARFQATENIDVWGILGYGAGELKILQEDEPALATDLGMRMVATGLRGELPSPDWGFGIDLAVKADAMWVQAESAAVGDLVAAQGEATRLRLTLEGSRAFTLRDGTLTLTGEAGLRHDGGDADTGIGLLVGGGVSYRAEGYTFRGKAHGVLAHAEKGFGEWGISGSVRIDPGILGRGLSLTVAPGWGAAQGGAERLQTYRETPGAGPERGFKPEGRLEAEIGYGLRGPHGAGLLTPHAGLSLSDRGTRRWRAGARWRVVPQTTLGLEGSREETRSRDEADHTILFRASSRW